MFTVLNIFCNFGAITLKIALQICLCNSVESHFLHVYCIHDMPSNSKNRTTIESLCSLFSSSIERGNHQLDTRDASDLRIRESHSR